MSPVEVVQAYFQAMKAGGAQVQSLAKLFAADAVYIEPFSGQELTHSGRPAIQQTLVAGAKSAPPDLELKVNRIDVDGDTVLSEWTCTSPVFPAPIRGQDRCLVQNGLIQRLHVRLL